MTARVGIATQRRLAHLRTLARHMGPDENATSAWIGNTLWGRRGRKPSHFARPAGVLLHRLKAEGYVQQFFAGRSMVWFITAAGYAKASEVQP